MSGLAEALGAAAQAPILLVACDFDGTLSALAPRPEPDAASSNAPGAACLKIAEPQSPISSTTCRPSSLRSFHPMSAM